MNAVFLAPWNVLAASGADAHQYLCAQDYVWAPAFLNHLTLSVHESAPAAEQRKACLHSLQLLFMGTLCACHSDSRSIYIFRSLVTHFPYFCKEGAQIPEHMYSDFQGYNGLENNSGVNIRTLRSM